MKDIKVLPREEVITKHKPLVCDLRQRERKRQREKNCTYENLYGNYMKTMYKYMVKSVRCRMEELQLGRSKNKKSGRQTFQL